MSISRSASTCLTSSSAGVPCPLPDESVGIEILGNSAAMRRLRLQLRRIGPHFRTVLVSGEAGTGKELVARRLHAMSPGAGGPFFTYDAAALEGFLVECGSRACSADAIGDLMQKAQRGTLFLDGVSEMSLEAQRQLLRALENHELAQSSLEAWQRVDLRMIASTSEDLKILVSTGRFRQDLYQRIATVDIALPPLRDRIEDLPELARSFLDRFAVRYGKQVHKIADEVMDRMQRYHWPGNVRELEDMMCSGVVQNNGTVFEAHHLPVLAELNEPVSATFGARDSVRLQDVVQQHVLRVLKDCGGNKLRAAEMLGISRSTLYRMLESCSPLVVLR